jgi:cell division protein FtsI (penicillin-binding protein 3)
LVVLYNKFNQPDTVLDTTPYRVNGHLIKDVGHWSKLSITGVLQKSSDIAVSHIALALPATVLPAVYHNFGLGRPTDLSIGNESSGYLPTHRTHWADIERATFSFGYGLRVTPLQMVREYATIGAYGVYRPLSITKVTPPVMGQQIMSPEVVKTVLHMMESDALPGGSGVNAAIPGYRLAIKTGTAEKMGAGGKYDGGYVNYTAGVAPASDPQVALVVMVNNPTAGKHFGGSVAAPVFGKIMSQVLEHLNILPDAQPLNTVYEAKG